MRCSTAVPQFCQELRGRIVASLFPDQPETVWGATYSSTNTLMSLSSVKRKSSESAENVGETKAFSPDRVPNTAFEAVVRSRPDNFFQTYKTCLMKGVFSRRWKRQKMVWLPNGNIPLADPSSYLLDISGNFLKRIIANEIEEVSEWAWGLSDYQ